MVTLSFSTHLQKSVPVSPGSQKRPINHAQMGSNKGYLWKMSCLRPAPPTRSYLSQPGEAIGSSAGNRGSGNKKKGRKIPLNISIQKYYQLS